MPIHHSVTVPLRAVLKWLDYQKEELSFGLKSPEDACKLYAYWTSQPDLPEFCDDPDGSAQEARFRKVFKLVLGYHPFEEAAKQTRPQQVTT